MSIDWPISVFLTKPVNSSALLKAIIKVSKIVNLPILGLTFLLGDELEDVYA